MFGIITGFPLSASGTNFVAKADIIIRLVYSKNQLDQTRHTVLMLNATHRFKPELLAGRCMNLSGLLPEPYTAYDDTKLPDLGIGLTSIVARTSRGSADLTRYIFN